ncbi:hypothetical protein BWI17_19735 [Betaproteobacteria bacterium GR16-43]|nr:hypothetical protein BWI17_19735 [Betaproteobacteria bacterium GR16-43]
MTNRIPVAVFFALFTVSGFAGLIYESIWSHYLKLFLGHAAYAQSLVLAIFMGGMALGSWLVSRFTHRIRDLLLGYAVAELGIGVLAILFHTVFTGVTGWAYDSVLPALGGSGGVDAFKWALASLLILPASVLLGTTFPLMSAGILRLYPDQGGRALSMLYFTNSLGAAFGVLVSGFFLIKTVGLPGTILTAGLMNITLAFVVWALTKRLPATVAPTAAAARTGTATEISAFRVVLALALITGAASFVYELTWIRMLAMGLGASTHAFEVMLAAFILGMSLGAYVLRNRIAHLKDDVVPLALILVAKGLLALIALWTYDSVLDLVAWLMQTIAHTDGGYMLFSAGGFGASMMVMLPTAFCAGMTLPLATQVLIRRGFGESSIGMVYGANTLGCIFGAVFTTHVGMEAFGVKGLVGFGTLLDLGAAVLLVAVLAKQWNRIGVIVRAAVVAGLAVAIYAAVDLSQSKMASGVFRIGRFIDPETSKVTFYKDGKTATVSVVEERSGSVSIRTNGKPDASVQMHNRRFPTADESTMILAGAIPLYIKPETSIVANIGFGSGLTTHVLLSSPNVKLLDTIEIEPAMVEGARVYGKRNERGYKDPRSHIRIEDAKTFFAAHATKYDVIVSEPSNPWVSGVSTLFSDEFYGQVTRYLKDDGLLVQWIQVYEINTDLVSSVFKALGNHFEDYAIYSPNSGDIIVIASKRGRVPPLSPKALEFPLLSAELKEVGYRQFLDLQFTYLGSRASLEPMFRASTMPLNSDYFPILDQNAARSRFKREDALGLQALRKHYVPFLGMRDGEVRAPREFFADEDPAATTPRRFGLVSAQALEIFETGEIKRRPVLDENGRAKMLLARAGMTDCRVQAEDWVTAVEELYALTLAYLSREEIETISKQVNASPCLKRLRPDQRGRLRLMEAVNLRDAPEMSRVADALLADPNLPLESRAPIALAGMAAAMIAGSPQKASAIWEHFSKDFPTAFSSRVSSQLVIQNVLSAEATRAKAAKPQ